MPLVAAGTTTAVTLPAGATMTLSGLGTHQTSPPGSNGAPSKTLTAINSQPLTIGPLSASTLINLAAAANGPGINYSFTSGANSAFDTPTANLVTVSRNITQADNGMVIPVANGVTLTIAAATLTNFSAVILPVVGATVSLAFSGGATGNSAATTISIARTTYTVGAAVLQDYTTGQDAFAVGSSAGGGGAAAWGSITGTLASQTDLQTALTVQTINAQTGTAYTLALTDAGQNVDMNNASANTLTIPLNATVAFPIGTLVSVTQTGAGATTIAGAGGVTLVKPTADSLTISAQYRTAQLFKSGTDTWRVLAN